MQNNPPTYQLEMFFIKEKPKIEKL